MAAAAGASAAALPVRPGEKPWTEAELKKVRQQLQSDTHRLRKRLRLEAIERHTLDNS